MNLAENIGARAAVVQYSMSKIRKRLIELLETVELNAGDNIKVSYEMNFILAPDIKPTGAIIDNDTGEVIWPKPQS